MILEVSVELRVPNLFEIVAIIFGLIGGVVIANGEHDMGKSLI